MPPSTDTRATSIGTNRADVVGGDGMFFLVDATAHGGVALRIDVDEHHAPARPGQRGGEVDARRGLANAAFLIGDRYDLAHRADAPSRQFVGARMTTCRAASRPGMRSDFTSDR
jgi:hypothetical protein